MPEERKLVTVLFADVTSSTALGEDLDPEDVRALMGGYYEHAKRVIGEHGGTLEKFIGDAVMAVFGLPSAYGDDAERAIAAALALRRAVDEDGELEEVALRMGVSTGEVVATSDPSRGDFLVTGDAVNVAARLQQHAVPGEILVSERTYIAAGAAFHFGSVREAQVKGKREPVRAYPVVGVREVRHAPRPPMVGREEDLMMLSLLHRRTVRERRPQLVTIVAPAGTGKTRLLEEFLDRVDEERGSVAMSKCLPYGQTLTYWPLRSLLEDLVGGVDRQRIVDVLTETGKNLEEVERLADLVLSTLGIEGDVSGERESIFNAWRLLIEAVAGQSARIVVFEDLHWASDSLLDLVEQIMHPRTRAPLLLIAVSRPELLERRPGWGGAGRQNFTTLVLEPLDEEQTTRLLETLSPDLPVSIRRQVAERSGGNPFFATELVRGLAERGSGAEIQPAHVVPDTVHAAVLARIDLLTSEERRVLQSASVVGRSFRPATLQATLEPPATGDLQTALDGLLARDMITPDEGDAFTFRHILIRDVAYGTLSRAQRVRMHAALAAWLEDFAQDRVDEFVELIAYHYAEAIQLPRRSTGSAHLPFGPARAVRAFERAAEVARRSGGITEAQQYLEHAITIADESERGRLFEKLADSIEWGHRAAEAYREAIRRWEESGSGDLRAGARLYRKLATLYMRWSPGQHAWELQEAIEIQARAERLAAQSGDDDEMWRTRTTALFKPMRTYFLGAERASASECEGNRAIALDAAAYFEARGDWDSFSMALDAYAGNSVLLDAWHDIIASAQRRLSAPQLRAWERGDAVHVIAWSYHALGELDRCVGTVIEALDAIPPGEGTSHLARAVPHAAFAALFSGLWDDLEKLVQRTDEMRQQFPDDESAALLTGLYANWLFLAMAREDRAAADAAISAIQRLQGNSDAPGLSFLRAVREDDPDMLDLSPSHVSHAGLPHLIWFLIERNLPVPEPILRMTPADLSRSVPRRIARIAGAMNEGDTAAVAREIDEAARRGQDFIPARMSIVLARMTGDPAPLERARPILERLRDRQGLRRLDEVSAALASRSRSSDSP